jgi:hypothetical protein
VQTKKLTRTVVLAFMAFSLSSLSFFPETISRTVACLPEGGGISGGPLPLGQDLIGQVQDEAIRESARDWYYYLTEVELRSLSQRQAVRTNYGLKTPLFATAQDYAIPSLAPFQLTPLYGASNSGLFAPPTGFTGFAVGPLVPALPAAGQARGAAATAMAIPMQSGGTYFRPRGL